VKYKKVTPKMHRTQIICMTLKKGAEIYTKQFLTYYHTTKAYQRISLRGNS